MAQQGNQPIFILAENTQRNKGRDAQRNNIMAAKLVAETVRTTLGPKGMDKMLVDSVGDIIVTNDGVTILEEMQIEHPAAKMIVEVAKTQEAEVGDGTTTAVILAGELLKNAEILLDMEVHPTVITKGYGLAAEKSIEILNKTCENISKNDEETLTKIAATAMTGKGAETAKEILADLAVKAVRQVLDNDALDLEDIKLEKKVGGGINYSELIINRTELNIGFIRLDLMDYEYRNRFYTIKEIREINEVLKELIKLLLEISSDVELETKIGKVRA